MQVAQLGITILILRPTDKEDEKEGWDGVRKMMNNPASFLVTLKEFGKKIGRVKESTIAKIEKRLKNEEF